MYCSVNLNLFSESFVSFIILFSLLFLHSHSVPRFIIRCGGLAINVGIGSAPSSLALVIPTSTPAASLVLCLVSVSLGLVLRWLFSPLVSLTLS
jgi:hypothetical protein